MRVKERERENIYCSKHLITQINKFNQHFKNEKKQLNYLKYHKRNTLTCLRNFSSIQTNKLDPI